MGPLLWLQISSWLAALCVGSWKQQAAALQMQDQQVRSNHSSEQVQCLQLALKCLASRASPSDCLPGAQSASQDFFEVQLPVPAGAMHASNSLVVLGLEGFRIRVLVGCCHSHGIIPPARRMQQEQVFCTMLPV